MQNRECQKDGNCKRIFYPPSSPWQRVTLARTEGSQCLFREDA